MIVDQPLAPFAVLAFLGIVVFTATLTVGTVAARLKGRPALSGLLLKILAGGVGLYFIAMLGASAFSKDYVLRLGAEKHFCELDCHIAYSVTKVEKIAAAPAEFHLASVPQGDIYIVTLRTRFDEATIGPQRGNGPLTPNPRKAYVRDESGKQSSPALAFAGTPLDQPLRPRESYETRLVFSLPAGAQAPRMFLCNEPWPNAFLIGHENSPLHGKAYFELKG